MQTLRGCLSRAICSAGFRCGPLGVHSFPLHIETSFDGGTLGRSTGGGRRSPGTTSHVLITFAASIHRMTTETLSLPRVVTSDNSGEKNEVVTFRDIGPEVIITTPTPLAATSSITIIVHCALVKASTTRRRCYLSRNLRVSNQPEISALINIPDVTGLRWIGTRNAYCDLDTSSNNNVNNILYT